MNVLSLFDGISCGQIALNRIGINIDNYFASEVDKHAIKVTMNNYPNTIQLGDVRNVDISKLPKIDLLICGSPCQNFSFLSTKRIGLFNILNLKEYLDLKYSDFEFDGHSYLFWEYVRLLKELKLKYFLLENVLMEFRWKNVITNTLNCAPIQINSSLVSAQNRQRLYWTKQHISIPKDRNITLKDILQTDNFEDYILTDERLEILFRYKNKTNRPNGFTFKLINDKLKSNCLNTRPDRGNNLIKLDNGKYRYLTPVESERLQTIPDNYTYGISDPQRYKCLGNCWTVDVIAHIFKEMFKDKSKNDLESLL